MADLMKELKVVPGSNVRLKKFDPEAQVGYANKDAARKALDPMLKRMDSFQYLMYSERKHSLLIILQGLDGAGKDGAIRHVFTAFNPQGCAVTAFKQPTELELGHDFLWRAHPHVPAKGNIAVFNRSYYEDVLVVRVHKLLSESIWSTRYEQINAFEKLLSVESNTTILKFFLHISKEEQLRRFRDRLEETTRQWKISDADYREREFWEDYEAAYEDVLKKTSTPYAPWFVIPADHKWMRDIAIAEIVSKTMAGMKFKQPKPSVDIAAIRRKYHRAKG